MKFVAFFLTVLFAMLAQAQTYTFYIATHDSNWNLPGNWSHLMVPTTTQTPVIDTAFTCTVSDTEAAAGLDVIAGQHLLIDTGANLSIIGEEDISGDATHFGAGYIDQSAGLNICATLDIGSQAYGQYGIIGGSVVCNTLVIDTTNGYFNLDGGALFINYGSGPDPINAVRSALAVARSFNWAPVAGLIFSTWAEANSNYSIGYADSADPGNPAGLPANTIKIMCTLNGDCNLDGLVNGTDFAIFGSHFGTVNNNWDAGDFNYDGFINGSDFALLGSNFGDASVLEAP